MPRPKNNLSSTAKSRAQSSAKRTAKPKDQKPKSSANNTSSNNTLGNSSNGKIANNAALKIQGLRELAPSNISGLMPQWKPESFQITDPLNPPETIPQVTEQQHERNQTIYQGGIRALKDIGSSFDLTKERFTTLSKEAKAFGAGVQAATEFEKVKGNLLDYSNQLEVNEQKTTSLDVAQHKTLTDSQKAVFDKQTMDEKLKQSEAKAQKAQVETSKIFQELEELTKQVGK